MEIIDEPEPTTGYAEDIKQLIEAGEGKVGLIRIPKEKESTSLFKLRAEARAQHRSLRVQEITEGESENTYRVKLFPERHRTTKAKKEAKK